MISVGLRLQLGLGTGLIGRLGGMLLKAQMIHMWELWIHVNTIEKKNTAAPSRSQFMQDGEAK